MKSLNALAALPRTNLLQALHARGEAVLYSNACIRGTACSCAKSTLRVHLVSYLQAWTSDAGCKMLFVCLVLGSGIS